MISLKQSFNIQQLVPVAVLRLGLFTLNTSKSNDSTEWNAGECVTVSGVTLCVMWFVTSSETQETAGDSSESEEGSQ